MPETRNRENDQRHLHIQRADQLIQVELTQQLS